VIGQVCLDEGSAAVRLRTISDRLSRTKEIRVTKRLANLVLSLALLSAYSVAQETEETTGTVYGVVTADADESCDSSPHGQLGKDLRLFVA
jgi:hypothetical protein